MRISDWSSDVCSSDLRRQQAMGIANDALATTRAAFGADYPLTHVVRYFTAECLIANDRFADARALLGGLDREKMAQLLGNPEIGAAIHHALAETALGSGCKAEARRLLATAEPATHDATHESPHAPANKLDPHPDRTSGWSLDPASP